MLASRSRLYPGTQRAMGWDVGSGGLKVVLGVEVPELVRSHVGDDVDRFLAESDLTRADVAWWVAHPGGPKVLEALATALEVPREALGVTWASLDRIGNLSSASVLHVLEDTLRDHAPAARDARGADGDGAGVLPGDRAAARIRRDAAAGTGA